MGRPRLPRIHEEENSGSYPGHPYYVSPDDTIQNGERAAKSGGIGPNARDGVESAIEVTRDQTAAKAIDDGNTTGGESGDPSKLKKNK